MEIVDEREMQKTTATKKKNKKQKKKTNITTTQLHSTKSELRFCASSNPACGMLEIHYGEDL